MGARMEKDRVKVLLGWSGDVLRVAVCLLWTAVVVKVMPELPVAENIGLWVYAERCMLWAVFLCVPLLALPSGRLDFTSSLSWTLMGWGAVEALWGWAQLYGFVPSRHSLYVLTGSFFNPGPYSGFLAMVLPLCLHEWFQHRGILRLVAVSIVLLIVMILPAGMSRSAWLAAGVSCVAVYLAHRPLRICWNHWRVRLIGGAFVLLLCLGAGWLVWLKPDSAGGRLLIWRMCIRAVVASPGGYGTGHFSQALGEIQEAYFHAGDYQQWECRVAGSPEYAFNEYLQIAVEQGIAVCIAGILVLAGVCWLGWRNRRYGICGSLFALALFACASYPLRLPAFQVILPLLMLACVHVSSRLKWGVLAVSALFVGFFRFPVDRQKELAIRKWMNVRLMEHTYGWEAYMKACRPLYPQLNDRPEFLFAYGKALNRMKEHGTSNRILQQAALYSGDPMILNLMGRNYQALGRYSEAEKCYLRAVDRLPGRLYPYYLLACLYAEPAVQDRRGFDQMKRIVLTMKPKVHSQAIEEMRRELVRIEHKWDNRFEEIK